MALALTAALLLLHDVPGRAAAQRAADATTAGTPAAGPAAGRLVILSTTDVKGKSSPCGCHTPKGGLARRAAFADSLRVLDPNLLIVDSGGFFPVEADYEPAAAFMLESMKALGVDAAGLGESDLRFGRGFLLAGLARTGLPVTCANLLDARTRRPIVAPYLLRQVGRAKVGLFGLIAPAGDLGPSKDSLTVSDPLGTAQRTVAALKANGATVIVLLSELGKIESEDVANAIQGIDVVIAGRKVPLIQVGRRIHDTLLLYGGEQSQYIGRTLLSLDAAGRRTSGEAELFMLGPDVGEKPSVLASVKRFEDDFNDELRRRERERALEASVGESGEDEDEPRDHYVGAEVCARCHASEYEQWKGTAHARAWATLVGRQSEARTDCVGCHVVGYQRPGGFHGEDDAPRLVNVQCENCHGMGTQHDATRTPAKLTELTCRQCHNETSSPAFSFAIYQPHIVHRPPAVMPPLPPRSAAGGMH
jgi:2',3'-cyclic-nucleotide 2'-phosphodiesterase (5'-nucleotidase family)